MKNALIGTFSYIFSLTILFLIMQYLSDSYPFSYKPKHKAGEYYEYWTSGNEFEKPKLLRVGSTVNVGKEYYLIWYLFCGADQEYQDTVDIKYADKYYKWKTLDQLAETYKKECNK